MNLPHETASDDVPPKVRRIGLVPDRMHSYNGEDINDWIKATWAIVALTGLFIAMPAAIALGLPAYNAFITYVAINLAGVFAWMLGLDAEITNLLYGRKTPSASTYHTATGARRAISIGVQVTMTIAVMEMLVLAGLATTAKPPAHAPQSTEQAQTTK